MRYFNLFIVFIFFSGCVTTKVFNDLEVRYSEMKIERNRLKNSKDSIQKYGLKLNQELNETKSYLIRSRDSINLGIKEIKILNCIFSWELFITNSIRLKKVSFITN